MRQTITQGLGSLKKNSGKTTKKKRQYREKKNTSKTYKMRQKSFRKKERLFHPKRRGSTTGGSEHLGKKKGATCLPAIQDRDTKNRKQKGAFLGHVCFGNKEGGRGTIGLIA